MTTTALHRALGHHAWNTISRRHCECLTSPAAVQELSESLFQHRQDLLYQMKLLEEAEEELAALHEFNKD